MLSITWALYINKETGEYVKAGYSPSSLMMDSPENRSYIPGYWVKGPCYILVRNNDDPNWDLIDKDEFESIYRMSTKEDEGAKPEVHAPYYGPHNDNYVPRHKMKWVFKPEFF